MWQGAFLFLSVAASASAATYATDFDKAPPVQQGRESSVWCHGSDHQDHRHCSFRNLCHSRRLRQFLFFHSPRSYVSGLEHPDQQRQIARLSNGMVSDTEDVFLDFVAMPASAYERFKISREDRPVVIMSRGGAGDFRKAVLEDLLPLYLTMKHLCFGDAAECFKKYTMAITDSGRPDGHNYLYQMLFEKDILWLEEEKGGKKEEDEDRITCFSKALVGMDHSGILDGEIRAAHLEEFRSAVTKKLAHVHSRHGLEYPDVAYLSPGGNGGGRLLNAEEVIKAAGEEFLRVLPVLNATGTGNLSVARLSMDQTDEHVIRTVSKAKLLIGPHGPHMSAAALFLPPGSGVMEIFPYALGPDTQGLTKYLAQLRGGQIAYGSWTNRDKDKSTGFPHRDPDEGGIWHLEKDVQDGILSMEAVTVSDGDAFADQDPAYLYRLNQQTRVDLPGMRRDLADLLGRMKQAQEDVDGGSKAEQEFNDWLIPSKVHGIRCRVEAGKEGASAQVEVTWKPPANLEFLPGWEEGEEGDGHLTYEVLVERVPYQGESAGAEFVTESSTRAPKMELEAEAASLRRSRSLKVWVSAVWRGARGPETVKRCPLGDVDFGGGGGNKK